MRKLISTFVLGLLAISAAELIQSKNAEAFIMFEPLASYDFIYHTNSGAVWCWVLLPFCLLDEKSGPETFTATDLASNGYSPSDIESITLDQSALLGALKAKNLTLKMGGNETVSSVKAELQTLVPNISDAYAEFLIDNMASN
jgi:hypothetical protein